MNKLFFALILFFLNFKISYGNSVHLLQLYESAKKHHKSFARVDLFKLMNEERRKELRSDLLPTVSLEGTWFYGNKTLTTRSGYDRIDSQQNLAINQTLYSGGNLFLYFDYKEILPKLALAEEQKHALNFFIVLNSEFFRYRRVLSEEKSLSQQIATLQKRVNLLKNRALIGRSKKTDYLSSLAQLYRIESELQQRIEEKTIAENRLKRLTGQNMSLFQGPIDFKTFKLAPELKNNDIGIRPEVKQLTLQIQEQQLQVKAAKSAYKPEVSLLGNYYFDRRVFGRQDDWDLSLNISWDIWDFSSTSSQVQQKNIQLKRLNYQKIEIENDLKESWKSLTTSFNLKLKRAEILKGAFEVAERNYQQHQRDFNKGLIDNIDLMRALDDLLAAETTYNQVMYGLGEQWYLMRAFTGELNL